MIFNTKIQELDTKEIVNSEIINWEFFKNSTIMVTGATGLIGSQIVNTLLYANETLDTNIKILALVRNKKKADDFFNANKTNKIKYVVQDILKPVRIRGKVDFIIHTANSTSSKSFVETPVETINSIVDGTNNILKFAKDKKVKGVIYLSSMEVYGTTDFNRVEPLKEEDLGYLDLSNPRSSYPEGKRLAENLCVSYNKEFGVPVKIARLCQTIGAGVDYNDARVFAQFARNIVEKQDIVLHTKGESIRSYCYITDAISAIFALLEKGKDGECYNVANPDTTCSIKEMAEMLCEKYPTSKFRIELQENNFYLDKIKYFLDISKIKQDSGWTPDICLLEMYKRLIISMFLAKYSNFQIKYKNFGQRIFSIFNFQKFKYITFCGLVFKTQFISNKKIETYQEIPIENNKIVFSNFNGKHYGCNPKYIAEEILSRKLPYKLVWLCNNAKKSSEYFPDSIKLIEYKSEDAIKELSSAKIWIDNQRKVYHLRRGLSKKDSQKYIQTWHGSLGIKKVGEHITNNFGSYNWLQIGVEDADLMDYVISNSDFDNMVFDECFWGLGEKKMFGHPRNDVFFKSQEDKNKLKDKILSKYHLNNNIKIILYAPTFRETKYFDCFQINCQDIIKSMQNKFGNDWILLIRLHPNFNKYANDMYEFSDRVINVGSYQDIQELLVASDVMITDYSSCIFDFMLSRKPAFIFATDIEKYDNERGFYYPLTSTPFPVATNNEELIQNIENFDYDKYKADVEEFLKEKGCMEDGHASERVVDLIEEIMNNGG